MIQTVKTILSYVKQYKLPSILAPLFVAFEVVVDILIPYTIASLIDKGIEQENFSAIMTYGAAMILLAVCGLIFGVLSGKYAAKASAGVACNIREAMFHNIQTFSFSNIDKFSTAGLITRMTTDVSNLQMAYQMIIRMCVRSPFMLISSLFMAFLISKRLSMVFVVVMLLLTVVLSILIALAMKRFGKVFDKFDDLNASVQENVSSIRVVKAFVREEYENRKFQKAAENVYRMFVSAEKIVASNSAVMNFAVYASMISISWIGAQLITVGELTTGQLTSLFTYVSSILMSLMMLSMIFVMLSMSVASAKRISEVLNETSDLTNPEHPDFNIPDGSVTFKDVSFSYRKDAGEPVLEHISFSVNSGETIGILGATGSAKSSLVNLISRLYDVTEGSVLVGGKDVRTYDLDTLRNDVSVVLQKNVLFSGSILENLRWGDKDASLDDCIRICKLAQAHDFISQFPNGYETYIEQGGTNVSGGQKQRLCIARALLKKPKILILDDSTSAVDTATDARIRKAFREEIPATTKFIIAQRISSIQDADRILVLEDGKISGFDTHENLLEHNEIYREVYECQTNSGGDFDEKGGAF